MRRGVAAAFAVALLAACSHDVSPVALPATSDPAVARLPGHYLLYIDESRLSTSVTPKGGCDLNTFALDLRTVFRQAVTGRLAHSFGSVEVVDRPVPADQLAARGKTGLITVRAGALEGAADVGGRLLGMTKPSARVSLAASLTVEGSAGRPLEAALTGAGFAEGRMLAVCGGVGRALGEAGAMAVDNLVYRMQDRLHSPR